MPFAGCRQSWFPGEAGFLPWQLPQKLLQPWLSIARGRCACRRAPGRGPQRVGDSSPVPQQSKVPYFRFCAGPRDERIWPNLFPGPCPLWKETKYSRNGASWREICRFPPLGFILLWEEWPASSELLLSFSATSSSLLFLSRSKGLVMLCAGKSKRVR